MPPQAVRPPQPLVMLPGAIPVLLPAGEELLPFTPTWVFPLGEAGQFFCPNKITWRKYSVNNPFLR